MILLLDNYDSFTYNLYQVLSVLGAEVQVWRHDVSVEEALALEPRGVVISPGPGEPQGAGVSQSLLLEAGRRMPVLGVCLGHQCIGAAFGGRVSRAGTIMHGKTSRVFHRGEGVFSGLSSPFDAGRYHSLVVDRSTLPSCLEVTAETEDGTVMGLSHRSLPIQGVQFHPESVLTPEGPRLLYNFLVQAGEVAPGAVPDVALM